MHDEPTRKIGRVINSIEETLIAVILGLMTLVTFANVVARYVFNSNILWALETTVFLFAWLILIGASYCVKTRTHLGVDVVLNIVGPAARHVLAIIAVVSCLAFCILLLIGAWNFWAPFAALPMLDGTLKDQAWYEVNDIPMPAFLAWLGDAMNEGEAYEKIPRFIPYAMLPFGAALLLFRFIQAFLRLVTDKAEGLIVSHEAEDAVDDVRHMNYEE